MLSADFSVLTHLPEGCEEHSWFVLAAMKGNELTYLVNAFVLQASV